MLMNNPRTRKAILITAIVLIIVAIIISVAVYRNKTIVLEVSLYSGNSWGVPQNFAYAIYDRALEMFEERYKEEGYRIKLRTGTMYKDYSEWFAQLVLKGKESDIFLILEEDFNTYAAIGLLENLDPYIEKSTFNSESFFSNALEAGQYQGSQFSVPIGIVPSFLIVNKDLLRSLDLQIDPDNWDWDQFYSLCEAITKDLNNDGSPDRFGVEGYDWHHAFYTNDATLFNEQNTQAQFSDERMIELLDFLKKLHALNQGVLVREGSFERGEVGFKTFNLSEFRVYGSYPYKVLRYNQFDWDVLPFPKGPNGTSKSKLYTVQMAMSSRSRNKNEAFKFLEFISSDEAFQYEIWNYSNMLPINRNVFELLYDSDIMQRDGLQSLDREFIESIIEHSYIDPNFKKYPVIDENITQRIFTIIAQDEPIPRSINDLRNLINTSLNSTPYVKLTTH